MTTSVGTAKPLAGPMLRLRRGVEVVVGFGGSEFGAGEVVGGGEGVVDVVVWGGGVGGSCLVGVVVGGV